MRHLGGCSGVVAALAVVVVVGLGLGPGCSSGQTGTQPARTPDAGVAADGGRGDGAGSSDGVAADVSGGGADTSAARDAIQAPADGVAAGETAAPACGSCGAYAAPRAVGAIAPEIDELSGLAPSRVHPGLLYTHNDSANAPRFFAINETGALVAELQLTGAEARDWEAVATAPCPAGSCVYIADIGDNDLVRDQYAIYRVVEPATLPASTAPVTVTFERFPIVYPDGRHNAETLLVHPQSGAMFIVTKATPPEVYEVPLPLASDRAATLKHIGTLALPAEAGVVTDGSLHPCGARALIRTKTAVFELAAPAGGALTSLFAATPAALPVAHEAQGEGVAYALDGQRYFTSGEHVSGQATPQLSVYDCTAR